MRQQATTPKPSGYILHEDRIRVIIATGFRRPTSNRKTGKMVQIWIIRKDMDPLEANRTNMDKAICGTCPLRGMLGVNRTCYVELKNAPLQVYRAYHRGNYPRLTDLSVFDGRAVRFGAYGDPAYLPLNKLSAIAARASSWTGYSHQWRNPLFAGYRQYLMASVENEQGAQQAHAAGWRTFRIVRDQAEKLVGEIQCVNESKGVQCDKCGLCAGASIKAKSITITVHGNGKSNFSNN